jgi:tRNA pseudouridine38-40 synthase
MNIEAKHGVLLSIAYDGSLFHGMARQPNLRTVAGELQGAIAALDVHASMIRHMSRTDAGVHAEQQFVSFDSSKRISSRGWVLGLSRHLAKDVAITSAASVPVGFDPRDVVRCKTYRYRLFESQVRDPFLEHRAWRIGERLNHSLMINEAAELLGSHDFAAFRSIDDGRSDTRRNLTRVAIESDPTDNRVTWCVVEGDRFLMHMVRIIVGTLVDVGRGRKPPGVCARALTSYQRADLGITAPPCGLYLHRVQLAERGADRWPQVDESPLVT